jgi:hypothetical protein
MVQHSLEIFYAVKAVYIVVLLPTRTVLKTRSADIDVVSAQLTLHLPPHFITATSSLAMSESYWTGHVEEYRMQYIEEPDARQRVMSRVRSMRRKERKQEQHDGSLRFPSYFLLPNPELYNLFKLRSHKPILPLVRYGDKYHCGLTEEALEILEAYKQKPSYTQRRTRHAKSSSNKHCRSDRHSNTSDSSESQDRYTSKKHRERRTGLYSR